MSFFWIIVYSAIIDKSVTSCGVPSQSVYVQLDLVVYAWCTMQKKGPMIASLS